MYAFSLKDEQEFSPQKHVEQILGKVEDGDVTIACWEPGQISPYHCHPWATEIYFCFEGGGKMKTPAGVTDVAPGQFVVHPPGEMHEYINGDARTLLFRVRYGDDMVSCTVEWPSHADWAPSPEDTAYFAENPVG